ALAEEHGGRSTDRGLLGTRLRGVYSPLYASPQQKNGRDPDQRDDVFALWVIWYQLLTGDLSQGLPAEWAEDLQEAGAGGALIRLLGRCVSGRAERRPTDADALVAE